VRPPHIPSRARLGHFHPGEIAAVLAFLAVVLAVLGAAAGLLLGLLPAPPLAVRLGVYGASLGGLACMAYGIFVEPWTLEVSRLEVRSPKLRGPVRLAHVSDLHMRRWTPLERRVLEAVRGMRPDAVLVTGDFGANPTVLEDVRGFIKELRAVAPVYCSRGNHEYRSHCPMEALQDLGARWLTGAKERLEVRGTPLDVAGVDAGDEAAARALAKGLEPGVFSVLLYHYPDLVPEVGGLGYDLMLCGHTHGGQVHLPGLGALICLSRPGTACSDGLFTAGGKAAYVSRGIGCESYRLPRVRFRCPPEVTLVELIPGSESGASRSGSPA
jgi:predicted MPP superfamily phosphohydrolase